MPRLLCYWKTLSLKFILAINFFFLKNDCNALKANCEINLLIKKTLWWYAIRQDMFRNI